MKLLLLGIDALDRTLLDKFAPDLPTFTAFREIAHDLCVRSTFPPDSDTAWATIYTGLNPAQHGIVRFVDPLEKSYQILNRGMDNSILHGKTFWELVGNAGYKTCALFPHLCYPLWETPGTIVVRGASKPDVQARPPGILEAYPDPESLLGVRGFPDRSLNGMKAYFERLSSLALADARFALSLLQQGDWDLFFVYWSTLDAIGHFFWNYFDESDPNFEPGNPLQEVILASYKIYDCILARFLASVGDRTVVMVLSDHGHGARPSRLVGVNEILRRGGYLVARDRKSNPHISLFERGKRLAVQAISRYGLGRTAGKLMRHLPGVVQAFTRPGSVDWDRTLAYATDMSGIKAYPYGGIRINREALNGRGYETARSEIIDLLERECVLPGGTSLIDFLARREEIYSGPYIENYPDLVLAFKYGYGLGWALNVPLISPAASYNLVPGSHRGDTGTCLLKCRQGIHRQVLDLLDITPTILDLFKLEPNRDYQGVSIFTGKGQEWG